jgi:hypothetical protein
LFGEVNPRDNDLVPLGVTPLPMKWRRKDFRHLIKRNGRVCNIDPLSDQFFGLPSAPRTILSMLAVFPGMPFARLPASLGF